MPEYFAALPTYIKIVTGLYVLGMFFFTVLFFVNWLRFRKAVRRYHRYGLVAVLVFLAFEVATVLALPGVLELRTFGSVLAIDLFVGLRLMAFVVVGFYYAKELGIPLLPLFRPSLAHTRLPASSALEDGVTYSAAREESHFQPTSGGVSKGRLFVVSLVIVLCAAFYSVLLFSFTDPVLSPLIGGNRASEALGVLNGVTIIVVLAFAFAEELIFRLGIQSWFEYVFRRSRFAAWTAIILSAALWSFAHVGMLQPDWVKLLQIFVIGLGFGWLYRKYGIESSLLAHAGFNVLMVVILYFVPLTSV